MRDPHRGPETPAAPAFLETVNRELARPKPVGGQPQQQGWVVTAAHGIIDNAGAQHRTSDMQG
jgi:hypothetical protein